MNNDLSLFGLLKVASFPLRRLRFPVTRCLATGAAALVGCLASTGHAETWALPTGGSWATAANWTPATVPNAIGAVALFSPINSANRAITIDSGAPGFTVGTITFDLTGSGTFTNSLTTGTAGSRLLLNNAGGGVTILAQGTATGNNTISVPLTLSDLVTAQVDQISSTSAAGALNLTATIIGTGSFIKQGDGLATFGTGTKTYTGSTTLNGGRMRISMAAAPTATSSFTVNAGAQLELITNGNYLLGAGPLNLNGTGAASGPFAASPGAIRNTRSTTIGSPLNQVILNNVVLQSDTLIHVQATQNTGGFATPEGSTTLSGMVSGPGKLTMTAPNSNIDQGSLILTNINTYTGGTLVNGGILNVNADAALGAAAGGLELNTVLAGSMPLHAVLRASGAVSTTARTLTLLNLGGTIDTNGNDVTFGVGSTITDAGLPATLRKTGAGKLTLAGTQTYDTLTTFAGRTDIASAVGTGLSTINVMAPAAASTNTVNISVSQKLAALTIGDGAIVTFAAPLPPTPAPAGLVSNEATPSLEDATPAGGFAQIVPEPGSAALLLGGLSLLLSLRPRKGA